MYWFFQTEDIGLVYRATRGGVESRAERDAVAAFLRASHATVLIDPEWSAVGVNGELGELRGREIFHDGAYRVYRLNSAVSVGN